jgi:hypothetical protein
MILKLRMRWKDDAGVAAKDVMRVLEWVDACLQSEATWKDIARMAMRDEELMRTTLGIVQARCTELLEENRKLLIAMRDELVEGKT